MGVFEFVKATMEVNITSYSAICILAELLYPWEFFFFFFWNGMPGNLVLVAFTSHYARR